MRLLSIIVAVGLGIAPQQAPAQAEVDVAQLVLQASRWTARFDQSLSGLLFREQYFQRVTSGNVSREVRLEANVFLLRPPAAGQFVIYRDVYRVNTRGVRDHTERLGKLLAADTADSRDQAQRLTDASARHNLGGIHRNVNVPTMAFQYLTPSVVRGLKVRAARRDEHEGLPVVVVEFEEVARPTLVRGADNGDVPAHGHYWIHPESGAVLRAHVELEASSAKGRMDVRLQLHDALKIWVPKEMSDLWLKDGRTVTGLARYDNFQRLTVSTAEIVK